MPGRREIVSGYSQAVQNQIKREEAINRRREELGEEPREYKPLTPTEYMLLSVKGPNKVTYRGETYYSSYKNADSARRAYTKMRRGETTGEKVYAKAAQYTYHEKEGGYRFGAPRGQYQMGLWLAYVTYTYTDNDGVEQGPITKSFVVLDKHDRFQSQFDTADIESELDAAVESKMSQWAANGSDASDDYEVISVQFEKIQSTSKTMNYIVAI